MQVKIMWDVMLQVLQPLLVLVLVLSSLGVWLTFKRERGR